MRQQRLADRTGRCAIVKEVAVRVLSLNATDGGSRTFSPFFAALPSLRPDIVTLQEMRAERISTWRDRLQSHGLHVADTFELADGIGVDPNERFRQDGLLVASRWPLHVLDPLRLNIPWPERVLSAAIEHPDGPLEVHTAHIPNASTGITLWRKNPELGRTRLAKKTETLEGLYQGLALNPGTPKILTGDFNTPRFERNDGSVGYWQDSCPGPLKLELQQRWETAEHNVIQGLGAHGMRDVFRALHGYETEAFSWEAPNKKSRYRYDHIFASEVFQPVACEYLHEFRINSSHHAAVMADLSPG